MAGSFSLLCGIVTTGECGHLRRGAERSGVARLSIRRRAKWRVMSGLILLYAEM